MDKVIGYIKANWESFAVAGGVFFVVGFAFPPKDSYVPFLAGVVAFFSAKYLIFKN